MTVRVTQAVPDQPPARRSGVAAPERDARGEPVVLALQHAAGNGAVELGVQRMPKAGGRRCGCGGIAGPDGECAACRARRLAGQSL